MRFAITVHGAPAEDQASRSALAFARAVLEGGHEIVRVFFQGAGALNASALCVVPQDEDDVAQAWAEFGQAHDLDLVVCVASALRRGILDPSEATRYGRPAANIRAPFVISGLGQLVDAAIEADRVVTFGS